MNGALSVPTSVPPLYTFTVTVPVPHVASGSSRARLSGTVHWYTTRPLLLFTVRSPVMLPDAVPSRYPHTKLYPYPGRVMVSVPVWPITASPAVRVKSPMSSARSTGRE